MADRRFVDKGMNGPKVIVSWENSVLEAYHVLNMPYLGPSSC
jgi:hypothetical protein